MHHHARSRQCDAGGLHPWQLHHGQCGSDEGVFGAATGSYFVVVRASAANDAMRVACGNLAPPTLWSTGSKKRTARTPREGNAGRPTYWLAGVGDLLSVLLPLAVA